MARFALLNPRTNPSFAIAENVIIAEHIDECTSSAELVIDVTDLPVGPGDKYDLNTHEWTYKNPIVTDDDNA